MSHLPCVLVSSVVRGARKGSGHGGLYVVDLELGEARLALDWSDPDIDFSGDGGDRGLRGLCVHGERVYVATSREILELDPSLRVVARASCPSLGHAHEMVLRHGYVWVTSTRFDSVLAWNPDTRAFELGLQIRRMDGELTASAFDPRHTTPTPGDTLHLNSVAVEGDDLLVSGMRSPHLFRVRDGDLEVDRDLPLGTHNVLPMAGGWVFNDTARDQLVVERGGRVEAFAVPRYPVGSLEGLDASYGPLARQGFARGLLVVSDSRVIGGSSPSTVTAWDLDRREPVASMCLTRDVRHAVHGIAPWPLD